jgi:hypothetical protein
MRVRLTRWVIAGLLLSLLPVPCLAATSPEDAGDDSDKLHVDLPMTVDDLWYRTGGKKRTGYLIVSEDGLEFVARKKTMQIPIDRLRFIDFGPMRGDVDTDWAVLTVGVKAPYDLIGVRDGSRWGFGMRTQTVHSNLLRVMRSLGAAQYSAADGSRYFQMQDLKCAFEMPENWHRLVATSGAGRSASGEVLFSADEIRTVEKDDTGRTRSHDDYELLDAINAGARAGFRVSQAPSGRGMNCDGFSRSAQGRMTEDLVQRLSADGLSVVGEVETTPATVGDCEAVRRVVQAIDEKQRKVTIESHVVAKNGRVYNLTLRELQGAEGGRAAYKNALRTLRLGGALAK